VGTRPRVLWICAVTASILSLVSVPLAQAASSHTITGQQYVTMLVKTIDEANGILDTPSTVHALAIAENMGLVLPSQVPDLNVPLSRAEAAMLTLRAYSPDVEQYATAEWSSVGGDEEQIFEYDDAGSGMAAQAATEGFYIGLLRGFPTSGPYPAMRPGARMTVSQADWMLEDLRSVLATSGTGPAWRWVTSWPTLSQGPDPESKPIVQEEAAAARRLDLMLAIAQGRPYSTVQALVSPHAARSLKATYQAWEQQARKLLGQNPPRAAVVVAGDNASVTTLGATQLTGYLGPVDLVLCGPQPEAWWSEQPETYFILWGDVASDAQGRATALTGSLEMFPTGTYSNPTDAVLRAPDNTGAILSADIGAGILVAPISVR